MPPIDGVPVTFAGEDRTLRYTALSLKKLEQLRKGEGVLQTLQHASTLQLSAVAALVWAGLVHASPKLTVAEVEGALVPPVIPLLEACTKALEPWLANADDEGGEGKDDAASQ
jgi:hypothetical protein